MGQYDSSCDGIHKYFVFQTSDTVIISELQLEATHNEMSSTPF